MLVSSVAHAAPSVWLGTFVPDGKAAAKCSDCPAKTAARSGTVRILSDVPTGEVVVASPVLGAIAPGKIDGGKVSLAWFVDDARDGDDGVLVLPAATSPVLVALGGNDKKAIEAVLLRHDSFGPGVRASLAGIEFGALDLDGDKRADVVATYGCNAWSEGCQGRGQFFLQRKGERWVLVE